MESRLGGAGARRSRQAGGSQNTKRATLGPPSSSFCCVLLRAVFFLRSSAPEWSLARTNGDETYSTCQASAGLPLPAPRT